MPDEDKLLAPVPAPTILMSKTTFDDIMSFGTAEDEYEDVPLQFEPASDKTLPTSNGARAPRSLKELREEKGVTALVASSLLRFESLLRTMCFIDNEHGEARSNDVAAIAFKIADSINKDLQRFAYPIRLLAIEPFSKRHHHINVEWFDVTVGPSRTASVVANLYDRSKRPEGEEEERVGPRRGGKMKKKGQAAEAETDEDDFDTEEGE
jgi:hypothetical protein